MRNCKFAEKTLFVFIVFFNVFLDFKRFKNVTVNVILIINATKRRSINAKEYYRLNTIVLKNVSINTLTNVTKEVQYCFVPNCRGRGCNKMLPRENCWEFCSKFAK